MNYAATYLCTLPTDRSKYWVRYDRLGCLGVDLLAGRVAFRRRGVFPDLSAALQAGLSSQFEFFGAQVSGVAEKAGRKANPETRRFLPRTSTPIILWPLCVVPSGT